MYILHWSWDLKMSLLQRCSHFRGPSLLIHLHQSVSTVLLHSQTKQYIANSDYIAMDKCK